MIFVVKRKDILKVLFTAIVAILLLTAVTISGSATIYTGAANKRLVPVYKVDTAEKKIALTFDAAWGADKTRGIIKLLKEYDVKATFFLVGFWIEKFSDETKLIANSGIEIGNHSVNHLKMSNLNSDDINKEIEGVNNDVLKLTGRTPKFFRAPFGDYNNMLIDAVKNHDMIPIQWSIDSLDWKGITGAQIAERVLNRASNGDIVLFHNNSDHILDALPIVLKSLKERGYKMVSLSNLVYSSDYSIDNRGVQHRLN